MWRVERYRSKVPGISIKHPYRNSRLGKNFVLVCLRLFQRHYRGHGMFPLIFCFYKKNIQGWIICNRKKLIYFWSQGGTCPRPCFSLPQDSVGIMMLWERGQGCFSGLGHLLQTLLHNIFSNLNYPPVLHFTCKFTDCSQHRSSTGHIWITAWGG